MQNSVTTSEAQTELPRAKKATKVTRAEIIANRIKRGEFPKDSEIVMAARLFYVLNDRKPTDKDGSNGAPEGYPWSALIDHYNKKHPKETLEHLLENTDEGYPSLMLILSDARAFHRRAYGPPNNSTKEIGSCGFPWPALIAYVKRATGQSVKKCLDTNYLRKGADDLTPDPGDDPEEAKPKKETGAAKNNGQGRGSGGSPAASSKKRTRRKSDPFPYSEAIETILAHTREKINPPAQNEQILYGPLREKLGTFIGLDQKLKDPAAVNGVPTGWTLSRAKKSYGLISQHRFKKYEDLEKVSARDAFNIASGFVKENQKAPDVYNLQERYNDVQLGALSIAFQKGNVEGWEEFVPEQFHGEENRPTSLIHFMIMAGLLEMNNKQEAVPVGTGNQAEPVRAESGPN